MLRPSSFISTPTTTSSTPNNNNGDDQATNNSKLSTSSNGNPFTFSGLFTQSFTLPKRTEETDLDTAIRRNSEVTQRFPSTSITADIIEVDKNLLSSINSWAFEGPIKFPGCLNPNYKPPGEKPETTKRTSVVIDEKKSFNELFDSLFSSSDSSTIEEITTQEQCNPPSTSSIESNSTTSISSSIESNSTLSPPTTTTANSGLNSKREDKKGGLKSLLFGKKYKPTITTNVSPVKETPKNQKSYKITHVPLMDEQFEKTGFKLELTNSQIVEAFRDVSRYNRKKDIDEQKRVSKNLLNPLESKKKYNNEQSCEDDWSTYCNNVQFNNPTYTQEEIIKRKKFIEKEIMENEIGYVRNLINLFEYYLLPIRKLGMLSIETYQIVFRNFNLILAINSSLLQEFERVYYSSKSKGSLTSVFSTRIPALKLYVAFVNSYPSAINCLNEVLTKDPLFESWEKSQRNIAVNGVKLFPLRSYIALPLQRITRYFLLFNDLLGTLEGDDHYSLCAVIDEMKALSAYCIEKKKESDDLECLVEFQRKLKLKDLVIGDRKFLMEGLGSADSGDNIELYLFSDLLVYVIISNDSKRIVKEVPLKAGSIIELTNVSATTFMISFQNEKVQITFDSEEDLKTWTTAINDQLNSSITKARIRRRGNSSTPQEERIVFAGYLTKSKGLSRKIRFHTLSSSGSVKYFDKPNGEMKGSYQIKGSKIYKKSPTNFLLTTENEKPFNYSTENDSIASTWINRFIGLGAIIVKQ